jgi:hypothetical protein
MNAPNLYKSGHSTDVRIQLCVNGYTLAVAQLGPDFLVLKNPLDHPPAEAEITMSIDGHESRWKVHLVDGIGAGQRKTRIRPCR